jgi:hypothetical protein
MAGTEVEPRPDRAPVHVPGMPQPRRESESAPARAFRSARRNRHVSVPLAVPPAVWTAGEIMHAYGVGWEALAAGVALSGNVWFFAPHKWTNKKGEPRAKEVWYARASAVAVSGWLTAAAFAGPVSGVGPELAGSLFVTSAAWGCLWWAHKRPRGMKDRERLLRQWRAWWEGHSHAWGVGGSRVIEAEEKGVTVRLRVQLMAGRQSVQHIRGAVHLIESALEGMADIGMVRVEPVKGNASQVDVFMKRENPLREVIEWDPSLAPRSVHEDAILGVSETGELVRAPMRVNAFVNGKTRSGKSNHLALRLTQLAGCDDDRQIVIDLKKRSARPLLRASAVDWVVTDRDEARDCLRMLCAEVAARSRDWDTGEEQALATPSTPALHAMIDEANPLTSATAGTAECARLLSVVASQGSGLEVYCEVYTQYGALEESVQTEQTRMNLPLRACYATEHADHGQFALGDGRGDTSKLEGKGEFLLKLGPRTRPERIRAPHMPHRLLEEITAANARRVRRPRLALWCGGEPSGIGSLTWQEWWDRRWLRVDPAFRSVSPQYAEAVERYGEPDQSPVSPAAPPPVAAGDDTGATVAAQIEAETAGDDIAPTATAAASAGSRASRLERFAAALQSAPGDGITRGELAAASGYSPSLVSGELKRLAERGAIVSRDQRWRPLPGRDMLAELQAVRAGDDALLPGEGRGLHLVSPAS